MRNKSINIHLTGCCTSTVLLSIHICPYIILFRIGSLFLFLAKSQHALFDHGVHS